MRSRLAWAGGLGVLRRFRRSLRLALPEATHVNSVSELHMSPTVCVHWCISALFGGVCGVHQGGEKCGGNLFALEASWLIQSESGIGFRQRCEDVQPINLVIIERVGVSPGSDSWDGHQQADHKLWSWSSVCWGLDGCSFLLGGMTTMCSEMRR